MTDSIRVKLTKGENIAHYQKTVVRLPLESYLRGVVPSEIKAGYTEMEAINAQAVAARTFAVNKIRHPRCAHYDLYDNVNDQSYDVTTIHSRADEAIKATEGQVLYYEGELIDTPAYSNANHGWTVAAEDAWHNPRPYLVRKHDPYDRMHRGYKRRGHGVGMSQVGANELAKLGASYREILAFYYKDIQLYRGDTGDTEELMEILRRGCKGEAVKTMQQALLEKGYDLGRWGADGDFGRTTQRVLKAFQKDMGLSQTGRLDEATAEALYGVDELTKLTMALQAYLSMEKNGTYDIAMAEALVDELGIVIPEELPTDEPRTEHFLLEDFEEMAPAPPQYYPLVQAEMEALERIYDYLDEDEEVTIHHGYRTQAWQDSHYPGKLSMHLYGGAADIAINGDRSRAGIHRIGVIAKELYDQGIFGGVGLGDNCVHVDIRHRELVDYPNSRALWFYNGYRNYTLWYNATYV